MVDGLNMATLTVAKYGSGNNFGALSLDTPAITGKKFHTGYYYALVPLNVKTLSAAVNSTATTLPISGGTSIYSSSGGVVWIDNERITYTGKTSNSLTGCTRGTNATAAASHVISSYVKFYQFNLNTNSNYTTARSEINTHVGLRGCLPRYSWRNLEIAEGVYDFTEPDAILADMKDASIMTNGLKRMCLLIELRTTDAEEYVVPDYVIANASSDTGQFQFKGTNNPNTNGWYPRLWNTYTRNRFILFLQALAAHYDLDDNFEMFQLSETALGNAMGTAAAGAGTSQPAGFNAVPSYYRNIDIAGTYGYFDGLRDSVLALNTAAPNTITCQLLNYDRPTIKAMIPPLVAAGVGLGCPNSLEDEPGLHTTGATPGIFGHFQTYKNVVPICPAIQKPEMFYSNLTWDLTNYTTGIDNLGNAPSGGTVPNPTFDTLATFLKDPLYQSNYIFVTRIEFANGTSNVTGNAFKDDFLTFLNQSPQNVAGGGLNATQPSKYSSVITT